MIIISFALIILGLVVLAFGTRLGLFAAGVGALLGIGFLRILPGSQENLLWIIIPLSLAILFALGAGFAKSLIGLVTLALGALAGYATVLAALDLFSLDLGFLNWILALIGAVIGAGFLSRFKKWTLIVLAAIVGALLTVRGLQMIVPIIQGFIATLVGLVLAGTGVAYHAGALTRRKQA